MWDLKIQQTSDYTKKKNTTDSQIQRTNCGYHWGEERGEAKGVGDFMHGTNYHV